MSIVQVIKSAFERSLVRMNKYPRIWELYLDFLTKIPTAITLTRRTFDRCLQSLSVTQHDKIWPIYKEWAVEHGSDETKCRVMRRYVVFDPAEKEEVRERSELWERFTFINLIMN